MLFLEYKIRENHILPPCYKRAVYVSHGARLGAHGTCHATPVRLGLYLPLGQRVASDCLPRRLEVLMPSVTCMRRLCLSQLGAYYYMYPVAS